MRRINNNNDNDHTPRTQIQTPNVRKTLLAVAPTDDDHDVPDEIRGVVAARDGLPTVGLDLLPAHAVHRHADVEGPDVVERLHAVPAAKDPDLIVVVHGGVGAARRGEDRDGRRGTGTGLERVLGDGRRAWTGWWWWRWGILSRA